MKRKAFLRIAAIIGFCAAVLSLIISLAEEKGLSSCLIWLGCSLTCVSFMLSDRHNEKKQRKANESRKDVL